MFSHTFSVRLSELDIDGKIQPYHIVSYFQDTASMYLRQIGMSGFDLAQSNRGWVVNAMTVLFRSPLPQWNEPVEITTWALNRTGVRLFRDFTAKDRNGEILAKGTSSWVIIDESTRQPVPQELFEGKELITGDPILPDIRPGRFSDPDSKTVINSFSYIWNPRTSEQDLNRHINNINYIIACIESVPQEYRTGKSLSRLDIVFRSEIYARQQIEIKTDWTGTDAVHRLVRTADETEICTARTQWSLSPENSRD